MPGPPLQPRSPVTDHPRDESRDESREHDETDGTPAVEPERPPPRFNPLVFGVVAATIQMAILLWLWYG